MANIKRSLFFIFELQFFFPPFFLLHIWWEFKKENLSLMVSYLFCFVFWWEERHIEKERDGRIWWAIRRVVVMERARAQTPTPNTKIDSNRVAFPVFVRRVWWLHVMPRVPLSSGLYVGGQCRLSRKKKEGEVRVSVGVMDDFAWTSRNPTRKRVDGTPFSLSCMYIFLYPLVFYVRLVHTQPAP